MTIPVRPMPYFLSTPERPRTNSFPIDNPPWIPLRDPWLAGPSIATGTTIIRHCRHNGKQIDQPNVCALERWACELWRLFTTCFFSFWSTEWPAWLTNGLNRTVNVLCCTRRRTERSTAWCSWNTEIIFLLCPLVCWFGQIMIATVKKGGSCRRNTQKERKKKTQGKSYE